MLFSTTTVALALACASNPDGTSAGGSGGTATTGGAGSGGGSAGQAVAGSVTGGGMAGMTANGGASAAGASGSSMAAAGGGAGGSGAAGAAGNSSSGAGGSAGAGGGSASGCTGVAAKFCDDFEAQAAGMAPKGDFNIDAKAGAIVVDGSKPYSGKQSLHLRTAKPGSQSFLSFSKQFPMNDFHGRAMFYVTAFPTAEIHWDLIDTTSTNSVHWEIGGMYGKFMFTVDPPDHAVTSINFPTGKWFCLQWEFKYGGQGVDNSFLAKMDGSALDKGQFTGADSAGKKWDAGPWKNFLVGWTGYGQSDVDIEEWIDDLAFGDAPIACPVK